MGDIYRTAKRVIAWLDRDEGETKDSFNAIRLMSSSPREGPSEPLQYTDWLAMEMIVQKNYFSRMWIIQEIILARGMVLMCGSHRIDWKDMV